MDLGLSRIISQRINLSTLDHYKGRPDSPCFQPMTLLAYTQQHTMPKVIGSIPSPRRKNIVVIARPYCSPDPSSPKYDQYCKQKLMLHVPFRQQEELLGGHGTYSAAYAAFLHSGLAPSSLEDDIYRLEQQDQQRTDDNTENTEVCYTCMHVYTTFLE